MENSVKFGRVVFEIQTDTDATLRTRPGVETVITRRRSESAYIHQVNFFLQLLRRVGEGDGAPLKLNLYLKTRFRNNRP